MINPIKLELFKHAFSAVAEEMGAVLQRSSFSPNIKERRDFSCALFNRKGELVAQAAHIPVHLGSMPLSVRAVLKKIDLKEGEVAAINAPYSGGTHLPDITVVAPVYLNGELLFYVANRAHHADVGGTTPGSMPLSTSIYQEGLIIPPVKVASNWEPDPNFLELLKANSRTPKEREGDFKAQLTALKLGVKRIKELAQKYSPELLQIYANALLDYAEKITRNFIESIPDGVYTFGDFMDGDGIADTPVRVRAVVKIEGDTATVDFSGSDLQTKGPINAVESIALSATLYSLRLLMEHDVPTNEGIMRPVKVVTRKGTVVDALPPAPVSAGNTETSQRLVDVLLGALSKALPKKVPAASQGTMNNLTLGGTDLEGNPFAYYETIGGGAGATPKENGESGVHTHMTNTLNTPVEALEFKLPVMVTEYGLRKGSGGEGKFRGGEGIVRELLFLSETQVTLISERRKFSPYGLFGGKPGKPGRAVELTPEGKEIELPPKFTKTFKPGHKLRVETPGGGGWGEG